MSITSDATRPTVFEVPFHAIDASNAGDFRDLLEEQIKPVQNLLLDFSSVEFVDSAGLGATVWAVRCMTELKGEIRICCPQKPVRALFELVRMNRITTVYETREQAINSFS